MTSISDHSIDMVLCDPPYGTTACKWDSIIPLEPMWEQLKRIIKPNGAIVMTASQPFTTTLIASNMKMFKYCWVWKKTKATGFFDCRKSPLNNIDDVVVFGDKQTTYNPQMRVADRVYKRGFVKRKKSDCYGKEKDFIQKESGMRYPNRVISIGNASTKGVVHPTQKPVALMEYLIKTYTNEGETVLDFAMGSGTTGVACMNLGRRFIGCDNDTEFGYFNVAKRRIIDALNAKK